ncbi:signal peptidase I [Croceicoccus pelagius]|uniref:Signal peptidase I n=1 Tax=Croceicoccus pelagius TaxID=1703341 RepID=A0A917DKA6_9SPHN|nr:signal peptidase I [Croceicoccus pelagius]GGD43672.1 signal peptidase I [Croceicoccus pelagius]
MRLKFGKGKDVDAADSGAAPAKKEKKEDSFVVFLVKLAVVVFIFRSFIFSPFSIPSESMLPRLLIGDYLLAAKWPYGYTRYSLPFNLPLIPGRILASDPERGDIAVFKAPPTAELDYIKRVIGLPGDQIQMRDGTLYINGDEVKKRKINDFMLPITQNMIDAAALDGRPSPCARTDFEEMDEAGQGFCRYPRYIETLPEGRSYEVLDIAITPQDNTRVFTVPTGHVFMMGDNRDNSEDSRFAAEVGGGVGMVPMENLVGRAEIMMWSTDGSAQWLLPWTWFTAARWDRLGTTF